LCLGRRQPGVGGWSVMHAPGGASARAPAVPPVGHATHTHTHTRTHTHAHTQQHTRTHTHTLVARRARQHHAAAGTARTGSTRCSPTASPLSSCCACGMCSCWRA
jgi:hypothetical protein